MAEQENGGPSDAAQETPAEPVSETNSGSEQQQDDQATPEKRSLPEGAVALSDDDGEIPDPNDSGVQKPTRRRRRRRRRRGRGGRGGGGGGGGGGDRGGDGGGGGGFSGPSRPRKDIPVIEGVFEGVLELHPKGYGFLRDPQKNYASQDSDPFVSSSVVERFGLRAGGLIKGEVGPGSKGQGPRLKTIETIDEMTVEQYKDVPYFEDLTPITPSEKIRLETGPKPVTMRVMDLLTPIGKGQRALIVAPPRTGKTMLLQDIADSVSENHPELHLMVLLIDERPEEVTEMRRRVKGEVIASSMDREIESHVRIGQLIIERGKRLAEAGHGVFVLLDSITRTARAFNKWVGNTGRTMSGGLDVKALEIPRKMFGTARRFEEGGSLTVVATALIETGSRMDDAIFQEFKGTGNMEMMLSRDLADRRIWPAIDITRSGTRHEEKFFTEEEYAAVTMIRRHLITLPPADAMDKLLKMAEKFPSNAELFEKVRMVM